MKKILVLLACLFGFAMPAAAQFDLVTGQVLDPNGTPYSGATVRAQLAIAGVAVTGQATVTNSSQAQCISAGLGNAPCQMPIQGTNSFTLDPAGNISGGGISLANNPTVTPAGTQWLFSITISPGVPLPLGTGPQSFSVPITINSNPQAIGATLSAAAPKLANITSGSSGSFSVNLIDVTKAPYNVVPGFTIPDATFTNGQNTISAPNNDANFTSTMNGWLCWGTNLTLDTSIITTPSVVVLPQGVLTVTGAQSATCSGGNATQTVTAAGVLVVGPDANAASTTTGIGGAWAANLLNCGTVQLPGGVLPYQAAFAITNSVSDKCVVDNAAGYGAYGVQGVGLATVLAPTPNFSAASCTGTQAGDGCNFSAVAMFVKDLTLFGSGQGAIGAGFNGKTAVHFTGTDSITSGSNSHIFNVLLTAWGATTAGFTGLSITGESDASLNIVHNDGVGSTGCKFQPNFQGQINLFNVFCAVNNVKSMYIVGPASIPVGGAAGIVNSYGGVYGFGTGTGQAAVEVDSNINGCSGTIPVPCVVFNSYGDVIPYASSGTELWCHDFATCHIEGDDIFNTSNGNSGVSFGSSGVIFALNSNFYTTGAGASPALKGGGATSQFISLGGNHISSANGKAVDLASFGGTFVSNTTDVYSGSVADLSPTCTISGAGSTATCVISNQTNEKGFILITANGTGIVATGTLTITFAGTMLSPSGQCPAGFLFLNNAGTGTWSTLATVYGTSTPGCTTSSVSFTWNDNSVALTSGSSYGFNYSFFPR